MRHYIKRSDGVVQSYFFKDEKKFRREYRKAVPHRPRALQRKFKKRVRVYEKKVKVGVSYFSIYVVNAKGSGVGAKAGAWSFTVDASVYTKEVIDEEMLEGLGYMSEKLATWLVNEFGFHGAVFTTVGTKFDQKRPIADAVQQGFFIVGLDVEDVTMAFGDYRSRRRIKSVNACMLDKGMRSGSYSVVSGKVVPRVAPGIHVCR